MKKALVGKKLRRKSDGWEFVVVDESGRLRSLTENSCDFWVMTAIENQIKKGNIEIVK